MNGRVAPGICAVPGCGQKSTCAVQFGPFIIPACREHGMEGYKIMRRLDPVLDALTAAAE